MACRYRPVQQGRLNAGGARLTAARRRFPASAMRRTASTRQSLAENSTASVFPIECANLENVANYARDACCANKNMIMQIGFFEVEITGGRNCRKFGRVARRNDMGNSLHAAEEGDGLSLASHAKSRLRQWRLDRLVLSMAGRPFGEATGHLEMSNASGLESLLDRFASTTALRLGSFGLPGGLPALGGSHPCEGGRIWVTPAAGACRRRGASACRAGPRAFVGRARGG